MKLIKDTAMPESSSSMMSMSGLSISSDYDHNLDTISISGRRSITKHTLEYARQKKLVIYFIWYDCP